MEGSIVCEMKGGKTALWEALLLPVSEGFQRTVAQGELSELFPILVHRQPKSKYNKFIRAFKKTSYLNGL